jgi:hypothetical protein
MSPEQQATYAELIVNRVLVLLGFAIDDDELT